MLYKFLHYFFYILQSHPFHVPALYEHNQFQLQLLHGRREEEQIFYLKMGDGIEYS